MENEIVLFESEDDQVKLNVEFDGETVWLTKEQMAALFGRDRSVISRHISNIFREGEILEEGNVHYLHIANSDKPVAFYNLDAIISVGYRVKSKRGVEFRRWATGVLRQYVLDGYAANKRRLAQLGQIVQVMDRIPSSLEARTYSRSSKRTQARSICSTTTTIGESRSRRAARRRTCLITTNAEALSRQ